MNWRRASNYHLASGCGQYTVAKSISTGVLKYQAWHCSKPVATLIGTFDTASQAQACAEHFAAKSAESHDATA